MARPPGTWMFGELFFVGDVKEWSIEFWYDGAGASLPTGYSADLTAENTLGTFSAAVAAVTGTAIKLVGLRVETNFGAGTFGGADYYNVAGGVSGDLMPEDVAVVVRKDTAIGGKSGTGRWRMSGIPESFCTGSYLNAVGQLAYTNIQGQFGATVTDQGITWTPQLYSRKLNTLQPITLITTDLLLGTARRRRPRF